MASRFILDCAGRAQRRRRFRSPLSARMFGDLPVKRCRATLATAVQNRRSFIARLKGKADTLNVFQTMKKGAG
jgi:hypothetical protein